MRFLLLSPLHLLLAATSAGLSTAFAPWGVPAGSRTTAAHETPTVLFISSWGTKGPPSKWAAEDRAKMNPNTNVVAYLDEPQAVEARSNVDGTCLVSGLINTQERTDQFLFDLLNHEESAFEFNKIVAFVDDVAFAKKRLLSRSARYTGLLDKLDFVQATQPGALPKKEQLDGVKTWVAYIDGEAQDLLNKAKEVANTAKQAESIQNVAVLLTGATELDVAQSKDVVDALKESGKQYTLIAVGKIEEHPEGQAFYEFADFGTEEGVIPATAIFSRQESLRMVSELLQLECGVNKALSFAEVYNQNKTEAKLIRGLRQAGYARPQEIDHMIREGTEAYRKACVEFSDKNPDWEKGYTSDAWWEREEFQKSRRRWEEKEKQKEEAFKSERETEIESLAREWGKREYFRQTMAGTVDPDMSEEQFVESVWERAMFEGDLKYRQVKGETNDPELELASFKARQERKQKTMLARAKEELASLMEKEGMDGDDIRKIGEGDNDKKSE